MAKFDTKVNGDTVADTEYNNIVLEVKNSITESGQVIDSSTTQLSKSIANYAAVSTFYIDSGIADAYVLTPIGSLQSPNAYTNGMEIRFRAGNANTGGAATVNVNSLGVKNLKKPDGTTNLAAGEISTTQDSVFRYNGTSFILEKGLASETAAGIAEIATQAEVSAGTDDARFITPSKLKNLYFESAEQVITLGGSLTVAHGLGVKPKKYQGFFICKTAEYGFSVGDEIFSSDRDTNDNGPGYGIIIVPDSTNLFVRFGNTYAAVTLNKTTGAACGITPANWRLILRASINF